MSYEPPSQCECQSVPVDVCLYMCISCITIAGFGPGAGPDAEKDESDAAGEKKDEKKDEKDAGKDDSGRKSGAGGGWGSGSGGESGGSNGDPRDYMSTLVSVCLHTYFGAIHTLYAV